MLGARKITSILTGFAFLLQTSLPPLASSAQSDDPIGAGGFIRPPQPASPRSNQTTQTSRNFQVRVCVPPDLVTNESWRYPYPGSEMDVFRNLLRDYILAHGDPRVQYRIKDQAFEIFSRARRASAPYTPDPRDLLEEVSAQQACPSTNYTNTLEVGPDDSPPNPTARPSAVKSPAVGQDPADRRCEELADMPYDPQKVGSGVPFAEINISEALPVCQQAATHQPLRPRYQYIYGRVLEAANRYTEAAQAYSLAEQAGYIMAASNLGGLYSMGRGVSQDFQKAASLYRQAANKGVSVAFYNLGQLYEMGQGVPQDWGEAGKWYQKAGDAGYADGYAELGVLSAMGNPPNYAEAAKWAQKAARGRSAFGSLLLGWHYQYGAGINKDPRLAKRWYEEAAKQGLTDAMYRLGLMYRDGEGVRQDPGTAAQWFYEAGRRGHPQAQEELGWMFFKGLGVKEDYRAALDWFLSAAQAGLVRSQTAVATIYDEGKVVARDPIEAVAWYRKAAAQNGTFATYQLGLHFRAGDGVDWSEAEAMRLLKKAGDQGSAAAEYFVAMGYEYGLGQDVGQGTQDYHQAVSWLTRSADHGNDYALSELGMLYENGWGVKQDLRQAKRLYQKASNSSIPEVAKYGREFAADLSDKDVDASPTRPPRQAEKSSGIVPLIAIGVGILALASLFGGPSSHDSASAPPTIDSTSPGSPSGTGTPWGGSPSPPPTSHQVPNSSDFKTPNGIDLSNPTHGGGPTHREH